jgi:hypothetical protein
VCVCVCVCVRVACCVCVCVCVRVCVCVLRAVCVYILSVCMFFPSLAPIERAIPTDSLPRCQFLPPVRCRPLRLSMVFPAAPSQMTHAGRMVSPGTLPTPKPFTTKLRRFGKEWAMMGTLVNIGLLTNAVNRNGLFWRRIVTSSTQFTGSARCERGVVFFLCQPLDTRTFDPSVYGFVFCVRIICFQFC